MSLPCFCAESQIPTRNEIWLRRHLSSKRLLLVRPDDLPSYPERETLCKQKMSQEQMKQDRKKEKTLPLCGMSVDRVRPGENFKLEDIEAIYFRWDDLVTVFASSPLDFRFPRNSKKTLRATPFAGMTLLSNPVPGNRAHCLIVFYNLTAEIVMNYEIPSGKNLRKEMASVLSNRFEEALPPKYKKPKEEKEDLVGRLIDLGNK